MRHFYLGFLICALLGLTVFFGSFGAECDYIFFCAQDEEEFATKLSIVK